MTERQVLEMHGQAQRLQTEGHHQKALFLLDSVAAYVRSAEGRDSPDLANVLTDRVESLLALCRYEQAEAGASESRRILEEIAGRLDEQSRMEFSSRILSLHGTALRELGRYAEAEVPLLAGIREAETVAGRSVALAYHLNDYGVLCKYWQRFEEAERVYRRALQILESEFGEGAVETAVIYHNLGGLEHSRGNFAAGEPLGRKAYEIHLAAYGEEDDRTMADAVAWGGLLDGLGRQAESLPIYQRALCYYEVRFGAEHFEIAATLNNLGMAYAALGRNAEAVASLERSLQIKRSLFGSDAHPEVHLAKSNLESVRRSNP
jgi:tetratricopeptide (TPR) repeat protein